MITEDNRYIPTAGEQKLIESLANPNNYGKSVTDICKAAKVTRTVYYDSMKKPEFVDYYHGVINGLLKGRVGNIINATYKYAIECPQNHQDRKILLEMSGVYTQKQQQEISGKDGGAIVVKLPEELKSPE